MDDADKASRKDMPEAFLSGGHLLLVAVKISKQDYLLTR